ncbi:endolytic transglycosylase MltG [Raineya sp.]|jgi:UPF0755 protein
MKKLPKFLMITFVVLAILLASFAFYAYQALYSGNLNIQSGENKQNKILYIPKGTDFQGLIQILKREQLINNVVSFAFIAKLMNYQQHVKAGAYLIEPNESNVSVIRKLRSGQQISIRLTFNNLRTKEDLAERISEQLPIPKDTLLALLQSEAVAQKYGLNTYTIGTIFIPNTYEVYWTTTAQELLDRMYKEYQKFWNTERKQKAQNLGLSPTQVMILASIVQAETTKNDEKPRIAGVYLNRLAKNDLLQADPTVIFAHQDFTIKRLLNSHLSIDSPYNTYKYTGLPPGAINFPDISSIEAVLNAEKHDYYYFCAREDFSGYHNFAQTLAEHNRNARLYQKALSEKGIK